MLIQDALARLNAVEMLPELRDGLEQMVTFDAVSIARVSHLGVIQALQGIFGLHSDHVAPFDAAWSLMYAAISRLDHLQDGDPVEHNLPTINDQAAQYNLVFGYYLLATSLLDTLPPQSIPTHRILRLRHLWSDLMLRMASGQQRDLLKNHTLTDELSLDYYQEIAQAKTGASFALAFGGTAILYSDDESIIEALILVGELYGTLLQYSDDIRDKVEQTQSDITLPNILNLTRINQDFTLPGFLSHIYHSYREIVVQELSVIPLVIKNDLLSLFDRLFM
jgi:hypothetical protein